MVEFKQNPEVLDELYIIDFDRTLVDTDRLASLLVDAAREMGFEASGLRHQLSEKKHKSFDLLEAALEVVGQDAAENLKEKFLLLADVQRPKKYADGGFFEPGARHMLGSIPASNRVIFTYGVSGEWQAWKLEAAGLSDQQHEITTKTDENGVPVPKPQLLAAMYDVDNGYFQIPTLAATAPIRAKQIVMIDDKPANLRDLPEGVRAYLYYPKRVREHQTTHKRHEFETFLSENPEVSRLKRLRRLLGRTSARSKTN